MLQGILDFFEMLIDTISSLIDFVVSFFGDIVYLVGCFSQTVLKFPSYIQWLPSVLISSLVAALTLLIVLRVSGRD